MNDEIGKKVLFTMYLQSFYNYPKDDRWLILMEVLRLFVGVDRRPISIHEMENILSLFRTKRKEYEINRLVFE